MKILGFLFLSLILTACSSDKKVPLSLKAFNKKCAEGKASGEYLIKTKDHKIKKIFAASDKAFYQKVQNLIEAGEVISVDYNFKTTLDQNFSDEIRKADPPSLQFKNRGPKMMNADHMWLQGHFGEGVKIALIDSGFDIQDEDLAHAVAINEEELGADEDNNQLVGDRTGWDFINNRPLLGDLGSHGTNVGSIIVAKHSLTEKISMAPKAKVLPIAALNPGLNAATDVSGDSNSILNALDYAKKQKVHLINASWGGDNCSELIRESIRELSLLDIIFVTASGNEKRNLDETPAFPASFVYPLVATVGATDENGVRLTESNFGSVVDFQTLGFRVYAFAPNEGRVLATGTSIATPFVTGALALLKSAFPKASSQNLLEALKRSTNPDTKVPNLVKASKELSQL